jgi:ATP-dependent phosphoenolpyruvate carboxykinase
MWMSNIYIMINSANSDHNSLRDLCSAVSETGATVVSVDESSNLIEAAIPSHDVPVVSAMEGVSYVRCVFSYLSNSSMAMAA